MSTKHTPGPWSFYDDSNDGKTNRIEIVAIGKTVARIYHSVPEEDLPNARLIAAAPDLLAACQKFMDGISILNDGPDDSDVAHAHELLVESFKLAHAAIGKATGEQP